MGWTHGTLPGLCVRPMGTSGESLSGALSERMRAPSGVHVSPEMPSFPEEFAQCVQPCASAAPPGLGHSMEMVRYETP
jgi:hypothetical protein